MTNIEMATLNLQDKTNSNNNTGGRGLDSNTVELVCKYLGQELPFSETTQKL